jgi:hypothetical protein
MGAAYAGVGMTDNDELVARLTAQRDHARQCAELLALSFDGEGGYSRGMLQDDPGPAPYDGWLPEGDR